jgi:hypothetical protein
MVEPDLPRGHPVDGLLAGVGHRSEMFVDAQGEIEESLGCV